MSLRDKKKYILDWKKISNISKMKFVKTILVWVVVVPIVAKILSSFKDYHIINFDFVLPFSWVLFYFSALFFLIGNVLYNIFVPPIINENRSFSHFLQMGRGKRELVSYLESEKLEDRGVYSELYCDKALATESKNEYFWDIWDMSLESKIKVRFFISIFYSLGILLILIVFFQNMLFVVENI
jgi:hypothetical protein